MSALSRRRHGLALLERDDELAAIGESLDDACDELGGLVVVEAPAAWRTRLVQAAGRAAREREMTLLVACGQELERADIQTTGPPPGTCLLSLTPGIG